MATKSFTSDTFVLNNNNASKFRNIMNSKKRYVLQKLKDIRMLLVEKKL